MFLTNELHCPTNLKVCENPH